MSLSMLQACLEILACGLAMVRCGDVSENDQVLTRADPCAGKRRCSMDEAELTSAFAVPLMQGQRGAIGKLDHCTAAMFAPGWLLTAAHCQVEVGAEFCPAVNVVDGCSVIDRVEAHPMLDAALLHVDLIDGTDDRIVPIGLGRPSLGDTTSSTDIETVGVRDSVIEFAEASIVASTALSFEVSSSHGRCFGDSGAPALAIGEAGFPVIIGVLSGGDPRCGGNDVFARVDALTDWVDAVAGPLPMPATGCGDIDSIGRCIDNRAIWCGDDGSWSSQLCGDGVERCGFDANAKGFRCGSGGSPCADVDGVGQCEDGVATWCENGKLHRVECASIGGECDLSAAASGVYCHDLSCAGLGWSGSCRDDAVEWCDAGTLIRKPCPSGCEYFGPDIGYSCL